MPLAASLGDRGGALLLLRRLLLRRRGDALALRRLLHGLHLRARRLGACSVGCVVGRRFGNRAFRAAAPAASVRRPATSGGVSCGLSSGAVSCAATGTSCGITVATRDCSVTVSSSGRSSAGDDGLRLLLARRRREPGGGGGAERDLDGHHLDADARHRLGLMPEHREQRAVQRQRSREAARCSQPTPNFATSGAGRSLGGDRRQREHAPRRRDGADARTERRC